jgi:hypothetical protein
MVRSRLTKKAEPPPTCDVNRDSGTDRANGGWLRRLVSEHFPFRHLHRRRRETVSGEEKHLSEAVNWAATSFGNHWLNR